jgi:hypothetical protein
MCETVARCMRCVVPVPSSEPLSKRVARTNECVTGKQYFLSRQELSFYTSSTPPWQLLACPAFCRRFGLHASTAVLAVQPIGTTDLVKAVMGCVIIMHAPCRPQQACLSCATPYAERPSENSMCAPARVFWAVDVLCQASVLCAQLSVV